MVGVSKTISYVIYPSCSRQVPSWSMSYHMCVCVCVCVCVYTKSLHSCLTFVTLWIVACQAPLSMEILRQECWSGSSCTPPGDVPNPGIKPMALASAALAGVFFTTSATWEAPTHTYLD